MNAAPEQSGDATDASTWREVLVDTQQALGSERDARLLCEHAAGLDAREFSASLEEPVTQRMALHLRDMVRRRISGEPLQYVMGRWAFRHLDLLVDQRVLIPRPETELVAETALQLARAVTPRVVVDLGTGSGAIGLSLAHELPLEGTTVWLADNSLDALDVARANAVGIGRAGANVRIAHGDWFAALPGELRGAIDVLVSNPPYIAVGDPEADANVVAHEPHAALYSGADGLDALRTVIRGAAIWLRPGGALVAEIGFRQGDAVRALCVEAGLQEVEVRRDYAGRDRILVARRYAD
ncbi:MAG: peptide chain release factor N(5)-glutamine methyltransferase [Ilumatobacteraceae bacterium]